MWSREHLPVWCFAYDRLITTRESSMTGHRTNITCNWPATYASRSFIGPYSCVALVALCPVVIAAPPSARTDAEAKRRAEEREVIAEMDQRIAKDASDASAYFDRGVAYSRLRQREPAIRDFSQVIRIDPNFVGAHNNRAAQFIAIQKYALAASDLRKAQELDPNDANVMINCAKCYRHLKQYKMALAALDVADKIDPRNIIAALDRGIVCREMQRFDDALVAYGKAIQIDPAESRRNLRASGRQCPGCEGLAAFQRAQRGRRAPDRCGRDEGAATRAD
ncbi:MAG: tetratricopeptide repeat protein [Pirellulales bacterium]